MLKVSETKGRIDTNSKINNYNILVNKPKQNYNPGHVIIYKTVNFKAHTYSLTLNY